MAETSLITAFDQLSALSARLATIYAKHAKAHGYTLNELHFLYDLARHQEVSPRDIGTQWSLPKQTISSILKQLESKELVYFVTDDHDKRSKRIRLTARGEKVARPLVDILTEIEIATGTHFGEQRLNTFLSEFASLLSLFEEQLSKKEY